MENDIGASHLNGIIPNPPAVVKGMGRIPTAIGMAFLEQAR
jgi:hypothetical protein